MKEEKKDWRFNENGSVTFEYVNTVGVIGDDFLNYVRDKGDEYFDEIEKSQIEKHGKTLLPKWHLAYSRFYTDTMMNKYPEREININYDNFK